MIKFWLDKFIIEALILSDILFLGVLKSESITQSHNGALAYSI